MDSFFGIGLPELIFILILAGIVMGPRHIRQVARTLGRLIAQMQAVSRQFTRQLNAELDAMDSPELKDAVDDMQALRREVDDLRRQVRAMPQELRGEVRKAKEEGERAFKPVSRQPDPQPAEKETGGDGDNDSLPVPAPDRLPKPIDVADDPQ